MERSDRKRALFKMLVLNVFPILSAWIRKWIPEYDFEFGESYGSWLQPTSMLPTYALAPVTNFARAHALEQHFTTYSTNVSRKTALPSMGFFRNGPGGFRLNSRRPVQFESDVQTSPVWKHKWPSGPVISICERASVSVHRSLVFDHPVCPV